ncbi:hypothetical protein F4808DRAFT_256407 [Astrocystis sublimbata]|nr:hypothetical protein F4808DRAFT_256407 [Astrocystis sublimbata]
MGWWCLLCATLHGTRCSERLSKCRGVTAAPPCTPEVGCLMVGHDSPAPRHPCSRLPSVIVVLGIPCRNGIGNIMLAVCRVCSGYYIYAMESSSGVTVTGWSATVPTLQAEPLPTYSTDITSMHVVSSCVSLRAAMVLLSSPTDLGLTAL